MSDWAIQVDSLWKKFRIGEFHDSLRDLIPDLCRKLIGRGTQRSELGKKEFWALRDVSFEVKKGESLGIIGPNGAGKTTLLKVLTRIMRPDRGRYDVRGRVSALIAVGAGFHPDLTGRENIYLNGAILGMKRHEVRAREEQIIEFAGVRPFIDTPVKRFSSGMNARLGFSVAAHLKPDVLLVDEVLSVGDAAFRAKCVRHMKELIQSDVTVVFISHILEQVRRLCPRTIVLDKGRSVYEGETNGAIRKYMDLLADNVSEHDDTAATADAHVRNIRFCDVAGNEVLEWDTGHPGIIECEVVITRPLEWPQLMVHLSGLGGQWLGTVNSEDLADIPANPGHYHIRIALDPIPFYNGDFEASFELRDRGDAMRVVWQSRQPRVVTVRDPVVRGSGVRCDSTWTVTAVSEHIDQHPRMPARP